MRVAAAKSIMHRMVAKNPRTSAVPSLSDEQRMLTQIRDTLYEGSWDDFLTDLKARAAGRPHVFAIGPASPAMNETIDRHIKLIEEMRNNEA